MPPPENGRHLSAPDRDGAKSAQGRERRGGWRDVPSQGIQPYWLSDVWSPESLVTLDPPAVGEPEPFDGALIAGNVMDFVTKEDHATMIKRVASHLDVNAFLVVGCRTNQGFTPADLDAAFLTQAWHWSSASPPETCDHGGQMPRSASVSRAGFCTERRGQQSNASGIRTTGRLHSHYLCVPPRPRAPGAHRGSTHVSPASGIRPRIAPPSGPDVRSRTMAVTTFAAWRPPV